MPPAAGCQGARHLAIKSENQASIRVAERLGSTLQGRVEHFGKEMLCYGIDRESYVAQWPVVVNASLGVVAFI